MSHAHLGRSGQATLAFVLLVGGIIVEIAIASSFITYFLNNSGFGERLLARARAAAQSGIVDAHLKLSRNKELGPLSYTVAVGNDVADVTIVQNTSPTTYIYTITARGIAVNRERTFTSNIVIDQRTGILALESLTE